MTCKGCFHYEACKFYTDKTKFNLPKNAENCGDFKDKGLILELPCKIGSEVYIVWGPKDRAGTIEYGVNTGKFRLSDLERLGQNVFFTREEAETKIRELINE